MLKTHIALLRGINVGGRNGLPMRELTALVQDLGASSVRTWIQSGNVVFRASADVALRVQSALPDAIDASLGFRPPVMLRAADEFARIVADNPLKPDHAQHLHVAFLDTPPPKTRLAAIDPDRSPGDAVFPHGRELYLHLPRGVAATKLTNAYLDATLGAVSTVRNWRTVVTLDQMARAAG